MTSEEFLEAISPIPEHNDYYFCRADTSLGAFGFCRAYINFLHMEDVFVFKDKFDGYVFVDTKGNEFVAIVEFAPFQRIPRRRFGANGQPITAKKRDNKCGTIEQDSDYTQFLEDLEKMKNETNMPSADVYLEEIEARDKQLRANHGCAKVSTPLIEFIKNRKLEKNRLREERREERKRQQLEQKRIREEEQQKKLKLLKSDDKSTKDSDQRTRDKSEKSTKSEDERLKYKSKDFEKRSRSSRSSDIKRTDVRKSEKKTNQYKSEKPKDSKDSHKESKDKESTFVVKVVQNKEENKTESNDADDNDLKKTDNNNKEKTNEPNNKTDDSKGGKCESSSKNTNESSSKSETKRIRNKDRPTREIYRPGATKRSGQSETSQSQSTAQKTSANKSDQNSTGYKQRVFTRSKH